MNVMMAVPAPSPFGVPHGPPMHPGHAPPYLDPGYAPGYSAMPTPPDARYASDPALPALARRRRVIVVLVSALVAVVVGIVVLLVLGDGRESAPTKPRAIERTAPPEPRPGSAASAPVSPAPERVAPPSAPARTAVVAPPTPECFADVSSTPQGAEIVTQSTVIGTTPQKVALPCGAPVELVIRKARLLPITRTITPTPEGAKLKVALAKQTFLIKVNSTPPGATVTLGGRSLGVTPTTVKVPAFELSVLAFSKEGYAIATEKVVPKASGGTVHSVLTRIGAPPR